MPNTFPKSAVLGEHIVCVFTSPACLVGDPVSSHTPWWCCFFFPPKEARSRSRSCSQAPKVSIVYQQMQFFPGITSSRHSPALQHRDKKCIAIRVIAIRVIAHCHSHRQRGRNEEAVTCDACRPLGRQAVAAVATKAPLLRRHCLPVASADDVSRAPQKNPSMLPSLAPRHVRLKVGLHSKKAPAWSPERGVRAPWAAGAVSGARRC